MNLSTHGKLPLLGICAGLLVLPPSLGEPRDAPSLGERRDAPLRAPPQQHGPVRAESTAAAPSARPSVRLAAGLLSVDVHDVKLIDLLDDVSRRAGFAVARCAGCDQTISLQLDRLPLAQALTIILQDQSFVLRWKHGAASRAVPQQLWLLPQPQTRQLPPPQGLQLPPPQTRQLPRSAPPAKPGDAREPAAFETLASRPPSALGSGTPDERAQAAADVGQRRDANAVGLLAQALADSDAQVRRAAIESLAEIGGARAAGALGLALRDADARIREAAVNALGDVGGPAAIGLLRQAQRDTTAFVRSAATETLEDLQARDR